MRFQVETSLEGFLDRWIEVTDDYDDFVPAHQLWQAMLHSGGQSPDRAMVWGMSRKGAFEAMRDLLPAVDRQRMRYCRNPNPQPGDASGATRPCYERIRLTSYANEAMSMPLQVRRRERPTIFTRPPRELAGIGVEKQ